LATVVLGGLVSATVLTLLMLPVFYRWVHKGKAPPPKKPTTTDSSQARELPPPPPEGDRRKSQSLESA
jgi:hypothetical protein